MIIEKFGRFNWSQYKEDINNILNLAHDEGLLVETYDDEKGMRIMIDHTDNYDNLNYESADPNDGVNIKNTAITIVERLANLFDIEVSIYGYREPTKWQNWLNKKRKWLNRKPRISQSKYTEDFNNIDDDFNDIRRVDIVIEHHMYKPLQKFFKDFLAEHS